MSDDDRVEEAGQHAASIDSRVTNGRHGRACSACRPASLVAGGARSRRRRRRRSRRKSQHGRLFPPQDLGLLEAPDRDEWQRPHQILDALGIADASVVADVGAGSGWFTVRLARRVGPERPASTRRTCSRRCWRRSRAGCSARDWPTCGRVLGRGSDPRLPAGTLDARAGRRTSSTKSRIASRSSGTSARR